MAEAMSSAGSRKMVWMSSLWDTPKDEISSIEHVLNLATSHECNYSPSHNYLFLFYHQELLLYYILYICNEHAFTYPGYCQEEVTSATQCNEGQHMNRPTPKFLKYQVRIVRVLNLPMEQTSGKSAETQKQTAEINTIT